MVHEYPNIFFFFSEKSDKQHNEKEMKKISNQIKYFLEYSKKKK